jgi:thioredoxin reductase (NADPH)
MEEALYLTRFASKVYLIHRRDALRASKIMQKRLLEHEKIEVLWNTVVEEVLGDKQKGVVGIAIKDVKTEETRQLAVTGFFLAIGHQPNTEQFKGLLEMDEHGYIKARPGSTCTNVQGVFVAGDVADPNYRQFVTAAGCGCMAAIDCERYLERQGC